MNLPRSEGEDNARENALDLDSDIGVPQDTEVSGAEDEEITPNVAEDDVLGGGQADEAEEEYGELAVPEIVREEGHAGDQADTGGENVDRADDVSSVPDDTPSIQGSILSSPHSEALSFQSPSRRTASGSRKPFDRRFQSRLSSSPLNTPRALSPAFPDGRSRHSSFASNALPTVNDLDPTSAPWDVIRWTKLRKLTGQVFSEAGKRNFGRPTCMVVTDHIVIGTSRGLVLVFDYQQLPKGIIGQGTKAVEAGPVTSLAISADHTTIAAGHVAGQIFTWEIARPTKPFLQINTIDVSQAQTRKHDGHIQGSAVLHIDFLGYRRTALVSADSRGMAFSHLATRGMGAVSRSVRTTRILGRYPDVIIRGSKPRKQSSVLAFSALPLGNVEQASDSLGLVAMMTPYLLVIVSTTPIAQTQHKAARPREVEAHSALSAALAWFPSIRLKAEDSSRSPTKLAYCWSNVLTILEISEIENAEALDKTKPPELQFRTRSRWKAEEAVAAVQWLNRSVIAVLTITQQLIIIEDFTLHVTDSFDLLPKQIYHTDLYSQQLHTLIEQLDEEDASMHGVVADAFHMSFKAYKGRLFLLGLSDVFIGSLSNWADRLLALMEAGDFIAAIHLATSYFIGKGEQSTIGLPEDTQTRRGVVQEKLLEMMSASLKYAFGKNELAGAIKSDPSQMRELAIACIKACLAINNLDFLFEDAYSWYEDFEATDLFLDSLEPYILDGSIRTLPPPAVKSLIDHFVDTHAPSALEELICLLDTSTMDIDQVTSLCKRHNLYDAYIYVWNTSLLDYQSPAQELLAIANQVSTMNGDIQISVAQTALSNAQKVFPYTSFILTGRVYPTGGPLSDNVSFLAKTQIYEFFFSAAAGRDTSKVPGATPYHHLENILHFDAAAFMSVLNEAFEDSFLNEDDDTDDTGIYASNGTNGRNTRLNRQFVVRIMLEVMTPSRFGPEDTIFLDMFVARNLPKYQQSLLLSGTVLHRIMTRLCHPPDRHVAEDCQLSLEYLFSIYHPSDALSLIPQLTEARFFRIVKSVYRIEQQYPQLIETFFMDDEEQDKVFDTISESLHIVQAQDEKQKQDMIEVVKAHAENLGAIDIRKTAAMINSIDPDLHRFFLDTYQHNSRRQFGYLQELLEPTTIAQPDEHALSWQPDLVEQYIQLMCQYRPAHVASYVDTITSTNINFGSAISSMENAGIIDAAVVLLARQGQSRAALNRLVSHLEVLESALVGVLQSSAESIDEVSTNEAITDLLESINKYAGVGIWLCNQEMKSAQRSRPAAKSPKRQSGLQIPLSPDEEIWLQVIIAVVRIARSASLPKSASRQADDRSKERNSSHARQTSVASSLDEITTSLRTTIQRVFSALLTSTTSSSSSSSALASTRTDLSFLRILRAFLSHMATTSPSLSELRAVLASIFSAYAYEESLLSLASSMLDKDLFISVEEISRLRVRGWRPRGQVCEVCRRRAWGAGLGEEVWRRWRSREANRDRKRRDASRGEAGAEASGVARSSGKGKATAVPRDGNELKDKEDRDGENSQANKLGPIIVYSCRHVYHKRCLDGSKGGHDDENGAPRSMELGCPICA